MRYAKKKPEDPWETLERIERTLKQTQVGVANLEAQARLIQPIIVAPMSKTAGLVMSLGCFYDSLEFMCDWMAELVYAHNIEPMERLDHSLRCDEHSNVDIPTIRDRLHEMALEASMTLERVNRVKELVTAVKEKIYSSPAGIARRY